MPVQIQIIKQLYNEYYGHDFDHSEALPRSGSDRQYIRLYKENQSVLAVYNPNIQENKAYFSFTSNFRNYNISVPNVLIIDSTKQYYLVEDVGSSSLYDLTIPAKGNISQDVKQIYRDVLANLVQIQAVAGKTIDYSVCYPVSDFDEQSIQWDLNYFKYNYLKLAGIDFNEYQLEKDFKRLKNYLLKVEAGGFMFRDFQSRNIMLKDGKPWYIDFQGGRRGPLVYDVASLLYQAKARFSETLRDELFQSYAQSLKQVTKVSEKDLYLEFKTFALLRTLQVLGAYGFRGYFEKKPHFIESIPFAVQNLKLLLQSNDIPVELPYLKAIAEKIKIEQHDEEPGKLTISVSSFSYRKGIPGDTSGNGGGFVFDCRGINNPGRFAEFQFLTGKDQPVIDFFKSQTQIDQFLTGAIDMVKPTIETYLQRGFKHLMVSFGCTGGQHRSVYCAQRFAEYLYNKYPVKVVLSHHEQNESVVYE